MKKNTRTIFIVLLALAVLASLVTVAACDSEPTTVKLTVDYNLEGVENTVLTVNVNETFLGKLTPPQSPYAHGGWYMSDGTRVTASTVAPAQDFTVKAKWNAIYRVEYYLEKLDAEGEYELSTEWTLDSSAELGSTVNAEIKTIRGFTFDEGNAANVKSANLTSNNVTLKLYYNRNTVTVTFDKLIDGASGAMTPMTGKYGASKSLTANGFTSDYEFVGWNTAADGSGDDYSDGEDITMDNITLYAQWRTTYSVWVYVEVDNGADQTSYDVYSDSTVLYGIIGHTVTAEADNPDGDKYVQDSTLGEVRGVVSEEGLVLKVYFSFRPLTIRYMDDNTVEYVKYGSDYVVRQAPQTDPTIYLHSYSEDPSGNGEVIDFGSTIHGVKRDITLYIIASDIYTDVDGSGDTVRIHRTMTGYGSAVLTRDGTEYIGRKATDESNYAIFEVIVETSDGSVTLTGRYGNESGKKQFQYPGEEAGAYLYYDYMFNYVDPSSMIMLDGYGAGVIATYANDGTDRVISYYLVYEYDEEMDDYYILYGLPSASLDSWSYTYFRVVKHTFEGEDYADIAGYFMENNAYGESWEYVWLDNMELYMVYMYMDGYGGAQVFGVDGNGSVTWKVTGTYKGSNYYYETDDVEFIFGSDNESIFASCYFTVRAISYGGQSLYVFLTKNAEYGVYTLSAEENYPEVYLDGYGGAMYTDTSGKGREGTYRIRTQNDDGSYTVIITFSDEAGGVMVVNITMSGTDQDTGMTLGSYVPYEGGFIIQDTVLVEYVYDEDVGAESVIVIPAGVTKIDARVFSGINITSVTFPESLTEIGDLAFSNGTASGGSSLQTAIFLGSTPPTLGEDVFRWIKGSNFRIVVPDEAGDAYRTAPTWKAPTASQPEGYAKFVITRTELANKPEFEVDDDGVTLISYNCKAEELRNITVTIPQGITRIADGVFTNLTYITAVVLSDVTDIGANAFYGCVNLKTVQFNPNTVSIGTRAFYNCASLTSVDLGGVETIGAEAFARCLGLREVMIGEHITSIGEYAFYECARTEEYGYNTDGELEEIVTIFDLEVTFAAATAPQMGVYIFQGSQPRLFVKDYDTALAYVTAESWTTYVKHVRVRAESVEYWYSKTNTDGWILELGDRLTFDDSYFGFYKWVDASTITVTWVVYSEIANAITMQTQTGVIVNNQLVGLSLGWQGGASYTFVKQGTTLTYKRGNETLEITLTNVDGKFSGKYNGDSIQFYMYGYRLRFEHEGYIYQVNLMDSNQFSYTRNKIVVITKYVAEDGSTLTIYDGDSITANGRLLNVGSVEGGIYTETQGWYLIKIDDTHYTFRWNHASGNYSVIITITGEGTFSYTWSIASTVTVYRSTTSEHVVVVTVPSDPAEETTITILFKTANGTDEQKATITAVNGNTYTIVIDGTVEVEDADGATHTQPSSFNGTWTLTLNTTNNSYTLVRLS